VSEVLNYFERAEIQGHDCQIHFPAKSHHLSPEVKFIDIYKMDYFFFLLFQGILLGRGPDAASY
jgi:hypothetical protein